MHRVLIILMPFLSSVNCVYTNDYDENTPRQFIEKLNEQDFNDDEPEPLTPLMNDTKPLELRNILCEDFEEYANNCSYHAKVLYPSTMTLPLPHELKDWCGALKYLTTCETDWNKDCKDVTEKNFNDLTIEGQLHVLDKVCHDDWFLKRYDKSLSECIEASSKEWKACYMALKLQTAKHTNETKNWAHYETHFFLCCARTAFRRCTLEALLSSSRICSPEQSILLQKFSAVISEGEVFQDCNFNMVFPSCPGGDPRPPTALVSRLMGPGYARDFQLQNRALRLMVISLPLIPINYSWK